MSPTKYTDEQLVGMCEINILDTIYPEFVPGGVRLLDSSLYLQLMEICRRGLANPDLFKTGTLSIDGKVVGTFSDFKMEDKP